MQQRSNLADFLRIGDLRKVKSFSNFLAFEKQNNLDLTQKGVYDECVGVTRN